MTDQTNIEAARLLSRVALRDRAAFDALYALCASKLFGTVLRLLKDKAEAEDALQEVFIRIWHKADMFAASGAPAMAWLTVLARNHAVDRLRRRKPVAADIDEAFDLASSEPSPEDAAQTSDDGRRIDHCLQTLDDDRADAVRGAYLDGYSYQELADRHKVPLNTMRTWLRRSLLKLRECLEAV